MKNIKMRLLFCLWSLCLSSVAIMAQLSDPFPFMTKTTPLSARITDYSDLEKLTAPAALVRLPNQKLAYMVRRNNRMEPFFIRAIETGYWDTRYEKNTNYDSVFADMKKMGANTAYVMLHWEDIEPADNRFDFTFPDKVVAAAKRQDMKIGWILFLHAQRDYVPSLTPETAWTFHLDDRDSSNYTMQWVKRNGNLYTKIEDVLTYGIRPLHVYGHKEIFHRIRRMLYNLAVHYKTDDTVIQVQLGNEEGFSFLDESDFNPVTAELYEEWKLKTNKTDYAQFKKEAIDWWWQQFTSAFHEGDPYKLLSFNLDAAQAETGDVQRVKETGTSASTYADGNLDVIGTMFYKGLGYQAFLGLDQRYSNSYPYRLPILIPSEIGIGIFNPPVFFRHFIIHSLERGAQGLGVYCYGEVRKELPEKNTERNDLTCMFDCIKKNEDILYGGLPGPGVVSCTSDEKSVQISHLNLDGKETLALVYFPEAKEFLPDDSQAEQQTFDINLTCTVRMPGTYHVTISGSGNKHAEEQFSCQVNGSHTLKLGNLRKEDVLFISFHSLSTK